ncbi:MAG: hypothetical protein RR060_06640, partial [Victivallaceae bacterium]
MCKVFCRALVIFCCWFGIIGLATATTYNYDLRMISKQSLPSGNLVYQLDKSCDNANLVDFLSDLDRVFARALELGRKNRNAICAYVIVPDAVDAEVNVRWQGGALVIEVPANFERISTSSEDLREIVGAL